MNTFFKFFLGIIQIKSRHNFFVQKTNDINVKNTKILHRNVIFREYVGKVAGKRSFRLEMFG